MTPSVIVVGAGVVGCAVAHRLASTGARVQVLETRSPGLGATRASAGVLAPYIEGHGSDALRALGRRSLDLYDAFVEQARVESGHAITYERRGTLEVALTESDVTRLVAASDVLWRQGVEARWVPPLAFEDYEPHLSPSAAGALLIPQHGLIGVSALTLALAAAAERHGARFKSLTSAIRIHAMPGGRVGVETTSASWDADRVVLAAGTWSGHITVDGADRVPVRPVRGQLLQLRTEPGTLGHVVWGSAGYLVPWPDGTVLVGATSEDAGFDETCTDEGISGLRKMAAALVPALADAPMTEARAGLRPAGPDDLPLVGPSAAVPGVIYATAHYRNGVLLAPLTAGLVSDLVFGRPADPDLAWLRPSRCGNL